MIDIKTLTAEDVTANTSYLSFKDKYIYIDNLDSKDGLVKAVDSFFNANYSIVITVVQGSMDIVVDGTLVKMKPNDYISIMPCTTVEIQESRAIFFCHMVQASLMMDIYNHIGFETSIRHNSFCFHYHHFLPEHIARLKEVYLLQKAEMFRPNYLMKEFVFRAFNQFLDLLNDHYNKERSVQFYAGKIGITSKYLSSITTEFAQLPASNVIDQYVVFRIKLLLYDGTINIKSISESLNFPTQSFFGRYFKRVTGLSPRQYIAQNSKYLLDEDSAQSEKQKD